MIQAMNTAAVGMKSQQQALDTIANNIANVETVGYKKDRVNFKDTLYVAMQDASNGESTENLQKGTGAIVGSVSKMFNVSSFLGTGSMLDVALTEENAFFSVESVGGDIKYTKDGSFNLSVEDDGTYLVNHSGEYILDVNEDRIRIPDGISESDIIIDDAGNMKAEGSSDAFATLAISGFQNLSGLEKLGGNCYAPTANSGEATAVDNAAVKQGYLEASNVQLGDEITNMIKAQRAYQLSSRVLSVADQMEEKANNLRR